MIGNILQLAISGVIGGIIGAFFTNYYKEKSQIKKEKIGICKQIIGNMFAMHTDNLGKYKEAEQLFMRALNTIFIVFPKSESIIGAARIYKEKSSRENLIHLCETLVKDLGISDSFNRQFVETQLVFKKPNSDKPQENLSD